MALTIAGSDPSGGAGVQADLKTFHALSAFGAAAITALTAQNTRGVHGVHEVPASFVRAQVDAVLGDVGADAMKTGMLASAAIIGAVADALEAARASGAALRYVCDPVMVAKGGARLLAPEAERALIARLLPLCSIVTPNADEVRVLTGIDVRTRGDMERAARAILALGPRAVLVKGGHVEAEADIALDLLAIAEDARGSAAANGDASARPLRLVELRSPRLDGTHDGTLPSHGAGCTLSAAIAALLARGLSLEDAVALAKRFLWHAMAEGGVPGHGAGHGCPDHRSPIAAAILEDARSTPPREGDLAPRSEGRE